MDAPFPGCGLDLEQVASPLLMALASSLWTTGRDSTKATKACEPQYLEELRLLEGRSPWKGCCRALDR